MLKGKDALMLAELPHKVVRPFWYLYPDVLDDRKCIFDLRLSPAINLANWILLAVFVVYAFAGGSFVFSAFEWLGGKFGRHSVQYLSGAAGLATVGLAFQIIARKLLEDRLITFNRETGSIRYPLPWNFVRYREAPFDELQFRLIRGRSRRYKNKAAQLVMKNPRTGTTVILDESPHGTDSLLGFWSFIVQYMDKDAPLPDVRELEDYPNRTEGLGSWHEWKKRHGKPQKPRGENNSVRRKRKRYERRSGQS